MAKTSKTRISQFFDASVAAGATDTQTSAIVPTGKAVEIKVFGGSVPDGFNAVVALQWGSAGGGFTTIRAVQREIEFANLGQFVGDGIKRFRLVRINRSAAAAVLVGWLEAIVHDA